MKWQKERERENEIEGAENKKDARINTKVCKLYEKKRKRRVKVQRKGREREKSLKKVFFLMWEKKVYSKDIFLVLRWQKYWEKKGERKPKKRTQNLQEKWEKKKKIECAQICGYRKRKK